MWRKVWIRGTDEKEKSKRKSGCRLQIVFRNVRVDIIRKNGKNKALYLP